MDAAGTPKSLSSKLFSAFPAKRCRNRASPYPAVPRRAPLLRKRAPVEVVHVVVFRRRRPVLLYRVRNAHLTALVRILDVGGEPCAAAERPIAFAHASLLQVIDVVPETALRRAAHAPARNAAAPRKVVRVHKSAPRPICVVKRQLLSVWTRLQVGRRQKLLSVHGGTVKRRA